VEQSDREWVINTNTDRNGNRVALDWDLFRNNSIYVHNTSLQPPITSILNTYKFGTNLVIHLLTRWEDKLRSAPRL
jgi:hypothetical protein